MVNEVHYTCVIELQRAGKQENEPLLYFHFHTRQWLYQCSHTVCTMRAPCEKHVRAHYVRQRQTHESSVYSILFWSRVAVTKKASEEEERPKVNGSNTFSWQRSIQYQPLTHIDFNYCYTLFSLLLFLPQHDSIAQHTMVQFTSIIRL